MERKQPKALYYLFLTEMWERFGFYTMVSVFVLYLTSQLDMTDDKAFLIFGAYTSFAWLTPVVGGILADRLLGFRLSIAVGAAMMSAGYLLLQFESHLMMFLALGVLAVGNGFFKANVAALLGQFYGEDDPRRSSGFTIFYMGINVGGLAATVLAGIVATQYSYAAAFAMAGIGKLISLTTFLLARRHLGDQGLMPKTSLLANGPNLTVAASVVAGVLGAIGVIAFLVEYNILDGRILAIAGLAVVGYFLYEVFREEPARRPKLFAFIVLVAFSVVFWSIYMQAGTSITLYTERAVNLVAFGFHIPPSDIQSLNPLFILLLAPIFAFVWRRTHEARIDISVPIKFFLGLAFMGSAFLVLRLGGLSAGDGVKVDLYWMVLFFLLYTMGEMSLSPVGLSMATELPPKRLAGFAVGVWLLATAGANYIAGVIAGFASVPAGTGVAQQRHIYESAFTDYGLLGLSAALLLLALSPLLRRMMR